MTLSIAISELVCEGVTDDEMEVVRGLIYAIRLIRGQTGHGAVRIAISGGKIGEMVAEHYIRPQIAKPWDR